MILGAQSGMHGWRREEEMSRESAQKFFIFSQKELLISLSQKVHQGKEKKLPFLFCPLFGRRNWGPPLLSIHEETKTFEVTS